MFPLQDDQVSVMVRTRFPDPLYHLLDDMHRTDALTAPLLGDHAGNIKTHQRPVQ